MLWNETKICLSRWEINKCLLTVEMCISRISNKNMGRSGYWIDSRGYLHEMGFQEDFDFPVIHFYILQIFYISTFCICWEENSVLFSFLKAKSLQMMPSQTIGINCKGNCPNVTQTGTGHALNINRKAFWWCHFKSVLDIREGFSGPKEKRKIGSCRWKGPYSLNNPTCVFYHCRKRSPEK